MLKRFLLIYFLCVITHSLFAQVHRERLYVKGGTDFWENLSKEMFLYPSFKEGIIENKDGKTFKLPVNYNRILATIQFIDEKHDTLVIADEAQVKSVKVDGDVFVFNPLCVQVINSGKLVLLKNEKLEVTEPQQVGAYGIPNSTTGIKTYNEINTYLGPYKLSPNEVLLCRKTISFYINTDNGQMVPASKQNILKASGAKQGDVKKFVSSKKINFDREPDLVELMNFISSPE